MPAAHSSHVVGTNYDNDNDESSLEKNLNRRLMSYPKSKERCGWFYRCRGREISTDNVMSRTANVCGSGRCCRGGERCVHGSFWRCRDRELSTNALVTGTHLFPSFTDVVADGWKHCLGSSDEVRCSGLKAFLQWNIEDECNKLARPSCACIVSCVKSLIAEKLRLCYVPLMW